MARITYFADVILPLALPNAYTYRVPVELNDLLGIGQRVIVQFGKNKLYTAIVARIHTEAPAKYEAKYIEALLDEQAIVTEKQLLFWEWMSSYYCCTLGETLSAALPSSLKLASETKLLLQEQAHTLYEHLNDKEAIVFDALALKNTLTLKEISEILDQKAVYPLVKSMLQKGVIQLEEEIKAKYKLKTEEFICLHPRIQSEDVLASLVNALQNAPKQLEAALLFLQQAKQEDGYSVKAKLTFQKANSIAPAVIKELIKKEFFASYIEEVSRLEKGEVGKKELVLSSEQERAYKEIKQQFEEHAVVLLHGVTASGKTEIYTRLIADVLEKGEQVLFLLPEIALTTQLIQRLQRFFGDSVGIYHSKFNIQERAEIWYDLIKEKRYKVIVGARSALFLPFTNLGLVIVDEEHEMSFKQQDPSPRYQGRDAAIVLAHQSNAKVVLGSATPSLESYWNAQENRYGLVELFSRYGGVKMPEILLADTKEEKHKGTMQGLFSGKLVDAITAAFEQQEQVILFQNRRGYNASWCCDTCGWVPMCHQCDISLTYHKSKHSLSCHYCGYVDKPPKKCSACGSATLKMVGFGTEKIEEELMQIFPDKIVGRMDYDTTRSKNAYSKLITSFEEKELDVLVGTQMVSKGLDFANVGLVGVIDAGQMLYFPDFRAFERAYQLMAQVAGRAGRKQKQGKVIIQTTQPHHWVLEQVVNNDYKALYTQEINERKSFDYPPFFRLISISLKHADKTVLDKVAANFALQLRSHLGEMVLGPEYPGVERVRGLYQKNLLVKFDKSLAHQKIKKLIRSLKDDFYSNAESKQVRISVDVDPY